MEIEKYKKPDAIAKLEKQVTAVRSAYDLVRMDNIEIANQENKGIIAQMIVNLNIYANVVRRMNSQQIAETVSLLLQEYPNLSLQEYQYFFNIIKSGYFGSLYESLDGIKLMVFMKEFYAEINGSYSDMKDEPDYQRKVDQGCRDIDKWNKY